MLKAEPFARKLLINSPLRDPSQLKAFVEKCLIDRVSIIACFGPGSDDLEDQIDWLVVDDGSDPNRFVCTSSHVDEPIDDVLAMLECWELERNDPIEVVDL